MSNVIHLLLYKANFNAINEASYAAIDDPKSILPDGLLSQCKGFPTQAPGSSFQEKVVPLNQAGKIDASQVQTFCGEDSICVIPSGMTMEINANLNVAALIVRGSVEWKDGFAPENAFLCSGYVAVEGNGIWDMNLQSKSAWIYIKDNGAYHPMLRTRAFGAAGMDNEDHPTIKIVGRQLERTWSLLSKTLSVGDKNMHLMHHPFFMGWKVGDRIGK